MCGCGLYHRHAAVQNNPAATSLGGLNSTVMPHAQRDSRTEVLADHHRQMLLALPFATVILIDDLILAANPPASTLLGPGSEGRPLSAWVVAADRPQLALLLATARHGAVPPPAALQLVLPDGQERLCELRAAPWVVDARPGALITLDDRTEARNALARERQATAHYRELFQSSLYPQCIFTLADGRIVESNTAFRTQIAARSERLEDLRIADFFQPGPHSGIPMDDLLARLRRGEPSGPTELRIRRPDGRPVWIEATIAVMTDPDGVRRTARAYIVIVDRRKQAEAALQVSEQRFRDIAEASSDWI